MKISQMVGEPTIPPAIGEGMAIVGVGAKPVKYYVHKALLVFHSEYFRKALQGPWKEADEEAVRLTDAGAAEFNISIHWLYTQQLPLTSHMVAHISGDEREQPSGLALNDFCENWYAKHDNKDDVEALRQFPMTFIMRAMRRYSLAGGNEGDGCFLEHVTVAERQSCKHTHPEYTAEHDGYGYVGELDD